MQAFRAGRDIPGKAVSKQPAAVGLRADRPYARNEQEIQTGRRAKREQICCFTLKLIFREFWPIF